MRVIARGGRDHQRPIRAREPLPVTAPPTGVPGVAGTAVARRTFELTRDYDHGEHPAWHGRRDPLRVNERACAVSAVLRGTQSLKRASPPSVEP
jgi:hypothetical protein